MVLLESVMKLKSGDNAPDFSLTGVDGKIYSLDSFKQAKLLLIIFMCNHCPYVKPKISRIKEIQDKFSNDLIVVGINSNESVNYPDDSFENMRKVAEEKKFNFLYLHDSSQKTAKEYGASCTPDPFLFNQERKLVYHGRLDNSLEPGQTPSKFDMEEAIEKVLSGQTPENSFIPSIGCSIKWKE